MTFYPPPARLEKLHQVKRNGDTYFHGIMDGEGTTYSGLPSKVPGFQKETEAN